MATRGKAREATIRALNKREAFDRRGSRGFHMWATEGAAFLQGHLPYEYWHQYSELARAGLITYTVLSYNTPIAWVTKSGTVVIPDTKYSVTTTHHQSLVRVYL